MLLDHVSKRRAVILLALLLVSATMLAFSCGASDDAAMPTARPEATTRPEDTGAEGAAQDGAGALRAAQVVHALEIATRPQSSTGPSLGRRRRARL